MATQHEITRRVLARLSCWLLEDAYPLWSQSGWDERRGGFHERLSAAGPMVSDARRVRVQLRQIYSFARAPLLGWIGDARRHVADGLAYFFAHYLRSDGLARTLVNPDGGAADDRALLYDQAFALLAFAEAHRCLGSEHGLRQAAEALLERIRAAYASSGCGFRSEASLERPLSSNDHMHLLEAALAWRFVAQDPRWSRLVDDLVRLALGKLIDARSGALREYFDPAGTAYGGPGGRLVEPGHQFEWAWLLLRAGAGNGLPAAARLVEIAETYGVHDGIAINSLLDDMTVHDPAARLWPQTERLKAHALMARMTGEPRHWRAAAEAAQALESFLETDAPGLWHDRRLPDGSFVREPSPASSFYHIVCAIAELSSALHGTVA